MVLPAGAAPYISEILLRPPGGDTRVHQYIELRGNPNEVMPPGTFLLAVEGDANGNPGVIQNLFNLSGRAFGQNGFLVLLQQSNQFQVVTGATVLQQSGPADGFGHGSSSTVGHRGEDGRTDLELPSVTFFLITAPNRAPALGDDLDANNDGLVDAGWFNGWQIWDSVGILDNTGSGDIAYGAINFRRNPAAMAVMGLVVQVPFTPDYVARTGNNTGSSALDWMAANNLQGTPLSLVLGDTSQVTSPSMAGRPLNHLGGPNFGAAPLPAVLVQPEGPWELEEGNATPFNFTVGLATTPAGPVVLRLSAAPWVELSANGGQSFQPAVTLTMTNTVPASLLARAPDNEWVSGAAHTGNLQLSIIQTGDTQSYPTNKLLPAPFIRVSDNDRVWLNELKINPPGADAGAEYVEIAGAPALALSNVWLVILAGQVNDNPGRVVWAVNLSGQRLGANGFLFLGATNHPYTLPPQTAQLLLPAFSTNGGLLPNTTATFLLLSTSTPIIAGEDWDRGDNGLLEGQPAGAQVLDSVAVLSGNTNAVVYSPAVLQLPAGTPDAATRWPGNSAPSSASAWFYGQLYGAVPESLQYDVSRVSPNFPYGALLTPGAANAGALQFRPVRPVCGTIGDPTNPTLDFAVLPTNSPLLIATAVSDNPLVVSNAALSLQLKAPGSYSLRIEPHGVGYANLTLEVWDGQQRARLTVPYAASAFEREGTRYHSGAADASTALALDEDWMLVGDDENQVLRLYSRRFSGPPVWQTNMTPFLGLTDFEGGQPREVDIEASVRAGNRIYWLGAHSHANIAEGRTNRSRLFATDLVGSGTNISLVYVGRYDYLKLDLVQWDASNGHGKGPHYYGLAASTEEGVEPKSPGGFNLEGLAWAPGSTNVVYVGFRAPLVPPTNRCYALVVPVLNFPELIGSNVPPGSARFGPPIEMDLFGRGIRSLEGDEQGYLIIAGTPLNFRGPYPDDFKLYLWSGQPQDPPQELTANLAGMNPEGIVQLPPRPWTPETQVQLVSDNGVMDWYGDGQQAKFLPIRDFRKFRSDWVALGQITRPAPLLRFIAVEGEHVRLRWRGQAGIAYRIQASTALNGSHWTDLTGDLIAPSPWQEWVHTNAAGAQRFYRIVAP
ncbi:MAG: hypothetical protein N3J91_10360 [Verrucomicrobiae bacterium]|nr:hypothetical protein [Verrucomicrobiae bacterium]